MEATMSSKMLTGLLAGLSLSFLIPMAAVAVEGKTQIAQSSTETGQTGEGVRGTTGESTGGGQTAPGGLGGESGATGTEGGAGGGATTMGQPPGGSENHVQEAMKHAQAAAASGKKGDYSTIAKHAQMSKTHVEAALKDKPDNPHLQAALKSLDSAIAEGNLSNGEKARKAAKEAVTHLNAVK
jgi:hypothetical protein